MVAMEGMLNGSQSLLLTGRTAGDRGEAGFLFDIPSRCSTESMAAPTAEEVEPWVETIIRLWDDAEFYAERSQAARRREGFGIPIN